MNKIKVFRSRCPRCGSLHFERERRLDGFTKCLECHYEIKTDVWDMENEKIRNKPPADYHFEIDVHLELHDLPTTKITVKANDFLGNKEVLGPFYFTDTPIEETIPENIKQVIEFCLRELYRNNHDPRG